jgi:large subunit ribosomal protein L19
MSTIIQALEREQLREGLPRFKAGDTLKVHFKVTEGTRERIQIFQGICIKKQGEGVRETFTVRKQSFGQDRSNRHRRRAPRQALLPARQSGQEGPRQREAGLGRHGL